LGMLMRTVSLLTAVHDNLQGLKNIYENIQNCLSKNINWVIKDSSACIKTKYWIQELASEHIIFISEPDTGIYNALNKGLKFCGDYYLVCGSDDTIYPQTLTRLYNVVNQRLFDHQLVIMSVLIDEKVKRPGKYLCLSVSLRGWVVSHSVGCLIKRSLHETFGYYDESFEILADSKFLTLVKENHVNFKLCEGLVAGEFSTGGISSRQKHLRAQEAFRYHVELNYNKPIQYILYFLRSVVFYLKKVGTWAK
jgi:glycosyltransferase involved in cell wall biosynthesis